MERNAISIAFGNRIREARKAKFDTQQEACRTMRCDVTSLSLYENGRRIPHVGRLRKICEVLELDFKEMLGMAIAAVDKGE